jgi:NDP-sugar pyrophosphorylase family protein
MKAVILAGGPGTRISEESNLKPKPMIEIGGQLILSIFNHRTHRKGRYEIVTSTTACKVLINIQLNI